MYLFFLKQEMKIKWQENNLMVQYPVSFWNSVPWAEIQVNVHTLLKDHFKKCIWVCMSEWVGVEVCMCSKWFEEFCAKFLDALLFQHHYCLFCLEKRKKKIFLPALFYLLLIMENILNLFLALLEYFCLSAHQNTNPAEWKVHDIHFKIFSVLKLQVRTEIFCGLNGEFQRVWRGSRLPAGNC